MFRTPFSFKGRIRRREYAISFAVYITFFGLMNVINISSESGGSKIVEGVVSILFLALIIPVLWAFYAQGAKRCHDIGKSGWWQIIPFFFFVLLFQDGSAGPNEYGENPKSDPADDIIDSIGKS
jgi:uncharacterized membrane protein YhaH (DUF805 family)